jgi:hypothetical protein
MAQFSVEIADQDVARVLNSLAVNYGRPEQVPNPDFDPLQPVSETNSEFIDNPETVAQFGNRMVRKFLTDNVKAYEIRLAKKQAEESVNTDISISDPAV